VLYALIIECNCIRILGPFGIYCDIAFNNSDCTIGNLNDSDFLDIILSQWDEDIEEMAEAC
jgi:hypothetical protein